MSQSSNDTFPTIMKITSLQQLDGLIQQLDISRELLAKQQEEGKNITCVGRTHGQDAVQITVTDYFSAYVRTIEKIISEAKHIKTLLLESPAGGTATGSLQNISQKIRNNVIKALAKEFDLPLQQAKNYFEQNSSSHDANHLASFLADIASDIIKICSDLRYLSSGPRAGINEITLPSVQAGSSIMPGKVNPSILEAMTMICADIIGRKTSIDIITRHAQLQLQAMNPSIARNLYDSLHQLTQGIAMLNTKCLNNISFNKYIIQQHLEQSFVYATDYSEELGYETVARLVKKAYEENLPLRELLEKKR